MHSLNLIKRAAALQTKRPPLVPKTTPSHRAAGEYDGNNPLLGHVLERLWTVLFGCAAAAGPHCALADLQPLPW